MMRHKLLATKLMGSSSGGQYGDDDDDDCQWATNIAALMGNMGLRTMMKPVGNNCFDKAVATV